MTAEAPLGRSLRLRGPTTVTLVQVHHASASLHGAPQAVKHLERFAHPGEQFAVGVLALGWPLGQAAVANVLFDVDADLVRDPLLPFEMLGDATSVLPAVEVAERRLAEPDRPVLAALGAELDVAPARQLEVSELVHEPSEADRWNIALCEEPLEDEPACTLGAEGVADLEGRHVGGGFALQSEQRHAPLGACTANEKLGLFQVDGHGRLPVWFGCLRHVEKPHEAYTIIKKM